jgi:hypothetical protein
MSAFSEEKPVYKIFTDEELTSIRNDSNNTNILKQYDDYAIVFALLDKCNDTTFSDRVKEMIKNIKENKTVSNIIPPIGANNHCQNEKNDIVALLTDPAFISIIKKLSDQVDEKSYESDEFETDTTPYVNQQTIDQQTIDQQTTAQPTTAQQNTHVSNDSPKPNIRPIIQTQSDDLDLYVLFSACSKYTDVQQLIKKLKNANADYRFDSKIPDDNLDNSNIENKLLIKMASYYSTEPKIKS